jgi:Domain of unknown function (DUF1648)
LIVAGRRGEDEGMVESSTVRTRSLRRRRATAGVTALVGLAVLGAAALVVNSWRGQLPEPVASHWGADGRPNGFSSVNTAIGVMLVIGGVLVLGFAAIALGLGQSALTRRIGAAGAIWSALFLSIVSAGSLYGQRGLADARNAPDVSGVLLVALGASLAAAVVVAFLVPGDPAQPTAEPVDRTAPRVPLTAGVDTVWSGVAESRVALLCGVGAAALVLAIAVWTRLWILIAVAVVVFAVVASMSIVTVRIDRTGVVIRSPLGWPRTRLPLTEVVRADTLGVRPLRDFGGWGWRVGRRGRVGVVLRGGESLLIERTGDRSTVVTVDGALAAAGTLNALADEARHGS